MVPQSNERGRFFCGSRISSAAKVTVFHASYANSALDMATPTAARNPPAAAGPNVLPTSGEKFENDPLLLANPTTTSNPNPPSLSTGNRVWTDAPSLTPPILTHVSTATTATPTSCAVDSL